MELSADLRAQAEAIRGMAELVRRVGSGLSLEKDRLMMQNHALELEAKATGVDAQADVSGQLDAPSLG